MIAAIRMLSLGAVLMLGACVSRPPPGPAAIVMPGAGKDFAAFQQDDAVCRRHAAANTGYGDLALPHTVGSNAAISGPTGDAGAAAGAPTGSGAAAANAAGASIPEPNGEAVPNQLGYLQCMAARGDTVRPGPTGDVEAANWYGYPYPYDYSYPYPYGYGYGYPYDFYGAGFIGVFGGGFHDRDFHRRFFHAAGLHQGFVHGGGFHGGGFHGGGGHR
ncbi:hypothetical protein [Acidisphaera sp. S103]|uniref:hypothetical protein n=1 Tax=Acidisphaera sp. S103 TaxID=1747223 RepID=UPI00131D1EB5|nr:hypothetical protein [Acidisphaera sp. S103]